ncbi:MinD/ParA family ATP-binding protein [Mycobacterium sp.]|uniref:MinD/ParA family ATP-binding protein n=1 Tax=Mycobacterium sp. TaxID=1785 RepID=UPI002D83FB83|nr:MinD/ParA family protein [Mycobacterium sp.]
MDSGPGRHWQPSAGKPADINYDIRTDHLVKSRRETPEIGWRKVVHAGTLGTVNLGRSSFERRLNERKALIASNITGTYQIGVISIKGGVGKTRTVAGTGTVFGQYRSEPVIAIDANPTYGTLGAVVDPSAPASLRDWLADHQLNTYPTARRHTGKNRQGLEVLAGNRDVANPLALDAEMLGAALDRARQFYQLALIDCGCDIEHPVIPGVLNAASALVIVSTMQAEHARAAGQTIEWLAARNGHDLLKRTVVVLNDAFRGQARKFVADITDQFSPYVQAVKVIPWDRHLRDAATLDFEALHRRTQLAYIELAAELASGFAAA